MTPDLVRELFNSALANFTPDPVTNPPIVDIKMDSTGAWSSVTSVKCIRQSCSPGVWFRVWLKLNEGMAPPRHDPVTNSWLWTSTWTPQARAPRTLDRLGLTGGL